MDEEPDDFGGFGWKSKLAFAVIFVVLAVWIEVGPPRLSAAVISATPLSAGGEVLHASPAAAGLLTRSSR